MAIKNNIQFIAKNSSIKSILVTSTKDGEGKTTIAVNLGAALAQEDKKIVIIDGGCPSIAMEHGSPSETYINETNIRNLYVFSYSQYMRKNSRRFDEIMKSLRQIYDFIIIDSPSAAHISMVQDLSQYADSSILVIKPGKTEVTEAKKLITQLTKLNVNIMGAVLNKTVDLNHSKKDAFSDSYDKSRSSHKLKLNAAKTAYVPVHSAQAK